LPRRTREAVLSVVKGDDAPERTGGPTAPTRRTLRCDARSDNRPTVGRSPPHSGARYPNSGSDPVERSTASKRAPRTVAAIDAGKSREKRPDGPPKPAPDHALQIILKTDQKRF